MSRFVAETSIKNGALTLRKVPFKDNTTVKVVLIPKADLSKMSLIKARKLAKSIKGSLSDDIIVERRRG
jgi:hypothetical protein